jgi:hypothetical protein
MENTDLILLKSLNISDNDNNGGRASFTEVTSNILNNMFPNVMQSEREDGLTRYRKFFYKNKNSAGETASNSRVWISLNSTGGDYYRLKAGTNTDEQSDADDYTNWLGVGHVTSVFAVGTTSFAADFDNNDGVYNSSLIRMSDNSGGEEFLTVKASGGVSWVGNTATIHTTTPARNTYPTGQNILVSGVIDLSDLISSSGDWVETSVSGTYDESTYPLLLSNVGTVEDTWTLTFTSATTFTVAGTNTGALSGLGAIGSDYAPVNPNVGTGDYYFKLRAAGWGGTWAVGETVIFSTHHSAKSIWVKEVVPAGTSAKTNNQFNLKLYSEGA